MRPDKRSIFQGTLKKLEEHKDIHSYIFIHQLIKTYECAQRGATAHY
jgi:hypothetical protein